MQDVLRFLFVLAFFGIPMVAGYFLGRTVLHRLPEWVSWAVMVAGLTAILALFYSVLHGLPQPDQVNYLLLYVYSSIAWMFFGMTALMGRQTTKTRQENERLVVAWQLRLNKDESTTGNPLVVAYDLQRLGELNYQLRRYEDAFEAYERANAIFVKELADHPQMRAFYYNYAQALRRTKRDSEAVKVEQYATTLGGPDNLR